MQNELFWEDKLKACRTYGDVVIFRRELFDWLYGDGAYSGQEVRWPIFEKFRNKTNPMIQPIKKALIEGSLAGLAGHSKISGENKTVLEANLDQPYFQGVAA